MVLAAGGTGDLVQWAEPSVCSGLLLGVTQLGRGDWAPGGLRVQPPAPLTGSSGCFPRRVQVEFYVNENTFKERLKLFFIKNQRSSECSMRAA